ISVLSTNIKGSVTRLNLFKDPEKETAHDVRNQLISTRVFICALIILLVILIFYTLLASVTRITTIQQPTLDDYALLQIKYSQTLACPCTKLAIEYQSFISFNPTFHQICQSDFITPNWIQYLGHSLVSQIANNDIRSVGAPFFRTLSSFCDLSLESIENELSVFNSTKYVTKNVYQQDLFQSQTKQIVALFIQRTINSFLQTLSVVRGASTSNQLFSGLLTNWRRATTGNIILIPQFYYNDTANSSIYCSCKIDPTTCGQLAGVYDISELISPTNLLINIPNFRVGCYMVEAIFSSTFECFYNQTCFNSWNNLIYPESSNPFKASPMIWSQNTSRYLPTTKVQTIIEQLMIEQWNDETSFESYFNECNPDKCVYTYNKQADVIYTITTIIGLIGGITTVLKILISPLVAFIRRKKRPVNLTPTETDVDIQTIIEQLMIEQWNDETSFESYFNECNPDKCVYTYNKQADVIYTITTIIGLIGGITTVLKILISPLVAFIRRKKRPVNLTPTETDVD
ncbi:unnamed protein product, partial [Didymodactylos carnosus]